MEAIIIAVRALEEKDAVLAAKRAVERDRKRKQRGTVTGQSRDTDGTVTDEVSPLSPPLKVSPDPFKNTPPITPHPKRASRLPNDFRVPGEWIDWAMEKRGWTRAEATEEAECFTRYWQAKAGRDAAKLDWEKTWQNWATNSRRTGTARTGGSAGYEFIS
jgi:hypothetical protein